MKCTMLVAATFVACVSANAQSQVASAPATVGVASRRITLDIVVTDKSGAPVTGLQAQDFAVLDNKRPQAVTSFRAFAQADDLPLRVVFVFDEVNVPFRAISNARQQLEKYLRGNEGPLPVPMSLVVLDEKSTQVQGTPTRNRTVLADSVHAIGAGAPRQLEGSMFANEVWRVQRSLSAFEKLVAYEAAQPGRKLLVWLSEGWPVILDSADKLSPKEQQTNFNTLVKLSTSLRDGQITVYSIDPVGMDDAGGVGHDYYQNFLSAVPSANKFRSGDLALGVIAVQSGGLVFNQSNDVASLIGKCLADAKSYYSLEFDSGPAGHANEYHDLQVKFEKAGIVARTRTGYYAQP